MRMTSNVHTHTDWCDGEDSTDTMVKEAIALGFTDLGFSSHSSAPFDPNCPGLACEQAYIGEIAALRNQYAGRIGISCALELDGFCQLPRCRYDYIIGASHYVRTPSGQLLTVDDAPRELLAGIQREYSNDALGMAHDYYSQFAGFLEQARPDIVAHADLLTKYNVEMGFFLEDDPDYRDIALGAMQRIADTVLDYGGIIEVNTGAMARGLRNDPYPAPFLLRYIKQRGVRVIITSDAHSAKKLSFGFDSALELLKSCGFSSMAVLQGGRFVDISI